MTRRVLIVALLLAAAGCVKSPEATRTQGGGPGGDVGNRGTAVRLRGGHDIYYKTPCRTVRVKCSAPEPAPSPSAT